MDPEMNEYLLSELRSCHSVRTPSPSLGTPDSTSVDSARSSDEEWQVRESAKALRSQTKRRAARMKKFRVAALNYKRKLKFQTAVADEFTNRYYEALGAQLSLRDKLEALEAEKAELEAQLEAREVAPLPTATEATTCAVCLGNARSVAFIPCGHMVCCKPCATYLLDHPNEENAVPCPICKKDAVAGLFIYVC